ncbi:hypothetical protein [Arcticibacterium luteifluviistationis]|uniref:Secretion system C-terminal sorting domain-containing protein n=1 Tax=Arcticibacterium luteifluviistationis TaxID=1784714 RepID=A0A2Z4G8Q0_9BACT|nr:hypothetical protein [Arcticibacterium luteifluviistationis]AWV97592.1 hypothetical protein DJ013_05190 [Arcticibacterium luteifluviistationis]
MKKLLLLIIILVSPEFGFGQCVCNPTWPTASGAANVASSDGGICVNDTWTGFITDNFSGADICVTDNGKWEPLNVSLPTGFIGDFDLGINDGGVVKIIDGNPVISMGGKLVNKGGSFVTSTTGTLTFLDSVINNVGILNNGLIDINSGSLLTQNILNSGIINISSDGIKILGASNVGTINIDQDEIDVTLLRYKGDGSDYLTSPIDIDLLNNFGTVRLLGERVVEVGLGDVWNNNGSEAELGLDVLGDAGIFLNGGTLNNINGAKVLAGYFQNAYGHFINTAGSIVEVDNGFFNNGEFTNGGYIHVGADLQMGVPGIDILPFVNNNQISVEGDILIKGKLTNNGVISSALGLFEEGHIVESIVTTIVTPAVEYVAPVAAVDAVFGLIPDLSSGLGGFIWGIVTPAVPAVEEVLAVPAVTVDNLVLTLVGDDLLGGDGLIWLGTIPANILDVTKAVELDGESVGALNNTLVVGTDPAAGLAVGVFPVKLVSLGGKQLESKINVSWEATHYENFDSFLLEKSYNATSFEGVARVEKELNTLYNYDDFNPKEGVNYYRLKLIDTDGEYTYSKTIAVNYEIDGDYFTFENPVRDQVIRIKTNIKDSNLRLIDITGRNIPYEIYNTTEGYEVRPQRNPQGVLFVSMAGERQIFTKKAVLR